MTERRSCADTQHHAGYWFGLARTEITVFEPGLSMWGWGAADNVAVGAHTPLYARAAVLWLGASGRPVAIVTLDLGMVCESVRRAVLEELRRRDAGIDEHRLVLTATHTHSGPSGFSPYLFYAIAGPGFAPRVHAAIVRGAADAVLEALARARPGRVFVHAGDLALTEPVCFNRALAAYNRNADVAALPADRADEAVHRRMTVLRFEDAEGRARGLLCFFAVHGTSVHADNDLLHGDNKGEAARACERAPEVGPDFVALFAQEAAGDATPNYRWDARRGVMRGRYDDDFESAAHNGAIQARHALALMHAAPRDGRELGPRLSARVRYAAFHETVVDPDLADGVPGRRTGTARLGIGFGLGTAEGPGPFGRALARATARLTQLAALRRARRAGADAAAPHGRKVTLWELGPGAHNRIAGALPAYHPLVAALPDRRLRYYHAALACRGARILPWVPHHLPFQLVLLGDLGLAFVPFEPTTQCGRRLRAQLARELGPLGVREAVLGGYANAYASYLTTPEEYDAQGYEGASTLFGRYSLGAVGTHLRRLAHALAAGPSDGHDDALGEPPPTVPLAQWVPHVAVTPPAAPPAVAR